MNILLKTISNYQAKILPKHVLTSSSSAAVLILLGLKNGQAQNILLIKRPQHFTSYAGDICFPGGIKEKHDSNLLMTALRETQEEVGLIITSQQIIGQLDDFSDGKGRLVRPFVGIIDDDILKSASLSSEVEKIYLLPISNISQLILDNRAFKQSRRNPAYFYKDDNLSIWGLTATILAHFNNVINKTQHVIAHSCTP